MRPYQRPRAGTARSPTRSASGVSLRSARVSGGSVLRARHVGDEGLEQSVLERQIGHCADASIARSDSAPGQRGLARALHLDAGQITRGMIVGSRRRHPALRASSCRFQALQHRRAPCSRSRRWPPAGNAGRAWPFRGAARRRRAAGRRHRCQLRQIVLPEPGGPQQEHGGATERNDGQQPNGRGRRSMRCIDSAPAAPSSAGSRRGARNDMRQQKARGEAGNQQAGDGEAGELRETGDPRHQEREVGDAGAGHAGGQRAPHLARGLRARIRRGAR